MNFYALTLLLGSFSIIAHCVFPPGSCDSYVNITEPSRNIAFTSSSFSGYSHDDGGLSRQWSRFTGIGGDRIMQSCHSGPRGGFQYPIRFQFNYPTEESLTASTGTAYVHAGVCDSHSIAMEVVLCPGSFYIFKPANHPQSSSGFITYHFSCRNDSCGPLAQCNGDGGCTCVSGYELIPTHLPTNESYGCTDIDECTANAGVCGSNSDCNNTIGAYACSCLLGYIATNPKEPPGSENACVDIDECLENVCGDDGSCMNLPGSYQCQCKDGYQIMTNATPICQDIDECSDSSLCGPHSECSNTPGLYICACQTGFSPTDQELPPSDENICLDIDECDEDASVCGPDSNCTNSVGSYVCTCLHGYRLNNPEVIASNANPCTDIDECIEEADICGYQTLCANAPGTFYCSCPDGFYPSTGILWIVGVSFCQNLQDILNEIKPPVGQTKERMFLDNMDQQLLNNTNISLPVPTVANSFSASMEVSGVGPRAKKTELSIDGDGETGSKILAISDRLVSAMLSPDRNETKTTINTSTVALILETIGPASSDQTDSHLFVNGHMMDLNLESLMQNNNGSAAVAFMSLTGMEHLLSHRYFETENKTEMYSDVITAVLPSVNTTNLTQPVNFTIQHKRVLPESGLVTCVYWKDESDETMRWSVDGCWIAHTNENFTVCSCSHLSTFALILQVGKPPPEDPFLEWLNRMCVIVGLFFFALSILTFLLCSWNPKINNTARLHLCLNMASTHLLLLWNDRYVEHELACTVIAGLLHFLVVASFVWMLLEALQLHLLVRKLSRVQVIQRDGLPKLLLYSIGYGVPFVIVGVSALVYSDGYGASANLKDCWLSHKRNFNWAASGPVITILALNVILFCATLWSLRPTLAGMRSDVSQTRDTRLIIFKIVAQFVILGCTWIIGLYQSNLFFHVLFILLNSQQGTFLYIVHCVLNKEVGLASANPSVCKMFGEVGYRKMDGWIEFLFYFFSPQVREEYRKWLTCSFNKKPNGSEKDEQSVSEDIDKAEEDISHSVKN
ncbi:adhesion G protein-coupled receptor E2-like isoform X2 [Syngnathus scovelli]|uniref:adhesion G protein-coupled receptor E2-like isoform X2 n=1 Tax=Syngnathus scovelli TaxID=161590 RepID=UPI00210F6702|nr:adhesion G protein-coupled receptor E2-like isoform X2 [Syngnathus scovelli]